MIVSRRENGSCTAVWGAVIWWDITPYTTRSTVEQWLKHWMGSTLKQKKLSQHNFPRLLDTRVYGNFWGSIMGLNESVCEHCRQGCVNSIWSGTMLPVVMLLPCGKQWKREIAMSGGSIDYWQVWHNLRIKHQIQVCHRKVSQRLLAPVRNRCC